MLRVSGTLATPEHYFRNEQQGDSMKNGYRALGLMCASVAALMAVPALAQDSDNHNELTIGVGAGMMPSYDGSNDYRLIPAVAIRGKVADMPFFTRGTNLFLDVVPNRGDSTLDIGVGPVVGARFNRTGGIKDARVKALGELDTSWEAGGWVGVAKTGVITSDYDNLSVRVAYLKGVSGPNKSYVVTPAVEYMTPLSKTTIVGVSISADYVGKRFGGTYYDITPAGAAASGLGVYGAAGAKAGFAKVNLGLLAGKSLSGDIRKGWAVFAAGGYGRIVGRYADSPIVRDAGSRNQWLGGLGIAYTF